MYWWTECHVLHPVRARFRRAREFNGRHFLYHLARRWSEGKFWSRTALSSTGICVEMKRRTTPLNLFVIDNSTLWYADTLALWLTYETYASVVDTVFCRAGHQQRHSGVPYPCNERQKDPDLQFRVFQTEVVHFLRPLSFANFMDVAFPWGFDPSSSQDGWPATSPGSQGGDYKDVLRGSAVQEDTLIYWVLADLWRRCGCVAAASAVVGCCWW